MLRYFLLLLVLALAGCDGIEVVCIDVSGPDNAVARTKEMPVVNLPVAMRQANWLGSRHEGSCVYASLINDLLWQGREKTAKRIRERYGNGCSWMMLAPILEQEGIRYAQTINGDEQFVQWACDTRRGAAVTVMGGRHMVTLVHLDDKWAGILDSNEPTKIKWYPRDRFLAEWRYSSGWAITPIYAPAPPKVNHP